MKKYIALLVAALMMVSMTAYAVPSKTTQDMATVGGIVSSTGVPIGENFAVGLVEPSPAALAELANIAAVVADGGAVASYFADLGIDLTAFVPEGFDLGALELNEFAAFSLAEYDPAYGDMLISFGFATEYVEGQVLVVMIGIATVAEDGTPTTEWHALEAQVVDGLVQVTFPQDVLVLLSGGAEAMLAVLSGPVEPVE